MKKRLTDRGNVGHLKTNSRDVSPAPSLCHLCHLGQIIQSVSLSFPMCEMGIIIEPMVRSMDEESEAQCPANGKFSISGRLYHMLLTNLNSRTCWCLLKNTIWQSHLHIYMTRNGLLFTLPLRSHICMFCLYWLRVSWWHSSYTETSICLVLCFLLLLNVCGLIYVDPRNVIVSCSAKEVSLCVCFY